MSNLGWSVGNWKAAYQLKLPKLSNEEAELAEAASEEFRRQTEKKEMADEASTKKLIATILDSVADESGLELDSDQRAYLNQSIYRQTAGFGFIDELLSDQSLEEIAVIGLNQPVFVFSRNKGWLRANVAIQSQDYFVSLVNRMARSIGRRLTSQQPRLNAVLEGGSRLHASMPPISPCELTIRKFMAEPLTPLDLRDYGTWDAKSLALLSLAIQSDLSVVIAGNTASGKTSTLNALLSLVPHSERLLLIEETPEISLPHEHQIRLMPFEEGSIGMVELVRDSLRMRPDRVVVGEVRSPQEAQAFVESALSGQAKGCYCTFHAQSARDAMLRLALMGCHQSNLEGIDLIAVQRRVSKYDSKGRRLTESRKLEEIAMGNRKDVSNPISVFSSGKYSPSLSELLARIASRSGMSLAQAKSELAAREKFFRQTHTPKSFAQCFSLVQKFMFGGPANGH